MANSCSPRPKKRGKPKNKFNIHRPASLLISSVVLIWNDALKSNSPYWNHREIPCTLCTSLMFCSCSWICDILMHLFHVHHLWKMDSNIASQSFIWLWFPLLFWGSRVIFTVTCASCLSPSNQLFTKEQLEVEELQWFLPPQLQVTSILKPRVVYFQIKKV